ncbi:GNAT family N-acetyltransferase [Tumebacillus sp. DT12]|uniref:GNAT family N-acetyltransferase n=1 Tax=Tumebacillus lacus TaxID=2995335 RepID=A0ABT3WYT6_9BACL|nr:GNAT family N-acetyltransferase [Tumebacillus lacus]MCX7569822.1 GNAT family N-acetyltransferase [Tumebacillus lacus]
MQWHELMSPASPYWEPALALYERAFPVAVREPADVFVRSWSAETGFHFWVGVWDGQVAAMATAHFLEDVQVGFVVYLLVNSLMQSRGIGAQTLAYVESALEEDARKAGRALRGVVLETEREEEAHTSAERADCQRRLRFFARHGYECPAGVTYVQPPLTPERESAVPLHLLMKRFPGHWAGTEREIRDVIRSMYRNKYGKANGIAHEVLSVCEAQVEVRPQREEG